MSLSLARIAELVNGQLNGDGEIQILDAVILRDAGTHHITLVESDKYTERLAKSAASAVIVPRELRPAGIPFIAVDDPRTAFARIVSRFRPANAGCRMGVSPAAHVSPSASLDSDVDVHPGATVGDNARIGQGSTVHSGAHVMAGCQIGEYVTIYPGAVLYENTIVGSRSIIHAGAVLGAYGFGYDLVDGKHKLCAQLGNVVIGHDVEIGAGTTIDRGSYGATTIGDGTKIDNQVMIGHNCRIGRHNLLCAQVGIAGSCTTGDYVVMAGQVGMRDHISIGDRAQIGAKAGVSTDLDGDQQYLGAPAIPARQQMQIIFAQQKLPELKKKVRQLERDLADLCSLNRRKSDAA
jgi:UDP-3-O-[3-hydroxymyristoyl] glucosamine N-acyltransferase